MNALGTAMPLTLPLLSILLSAPSHASEPPLDEAPKVCEMCAQWSAPHAPFRLFGDSFYVGPQGLSVVVVRTSEGLVLLDGALPQSVAGIVASLETLSMAVTDIRYILVSHAHYDHVGGVAALQRRSGAVVISTEAAEATLRAGNVSPEDPQAGFGADTMSFPPVTGTIRTLSDGETLQVGETTFTLHSTAGHTLGGASFSWQSCEGEHCASIVYADSLNPVSAKGFRFTEHPATLDLFRASVDRVHELSCDILVPVHPSFGRLFSQAERAEHRGTRTFLDPKACQRYADDSERRLARRIDQEEEADATESR